MKMMATAMTSRMTTTIDRPISQARLPIKQAGLTQFLFVFNEMGPVHPAARRWKMMGHHARDNAPWLNRKIR